MMKTDIREHDAGYEVDIDLPGFKKDEISIELENGYLTVSAAGVCKDRKTRKVNTSVRSVMPSNAEKLLCR